MNLPNADDLHSRRLGLCKWMPSLRIQKIFCKLWEVKDSDWLGLPMNSFINILHFLYHWIDLSTKKDTVEKNGVFIESPIHTRYWMIVICTLFNGKLLNRSCQSHFILEATRHSVSNHGSRNYVHLDFDPCCYVFNSSVTSSNSLKLSVPHYLHSLNKEKESAPTAC